MLEKRKIMELTELLSLLYSSMNPSGTGWFPTHCAKYNMRTEKKIRGVITIVSINHVTTMTSCTIIH